MLKALFTRPPLRRIVEDQLYQAQRELGTAQAELEQALAVRDMLQKRAFRLAQDLSSMPDELAQQVPYEV